MKKFNSTKSVLLGIGAVTIIFGIIEALRSGIWIDQGWFFILGVSIIVIAFSLKNKTD